MMCGFYSVVPLYGIVVCACGTYYCVILPCGTDVWYRYVVLLCGIAVRYWCVVCCLVLLCGTDVLFLLCGMVVWYYCVVLMSDVWY